MYQPRKSSQDIWRIRREIVISGGVNRHLDGRPKLLPDGRVDRRPVMIDAESVEKNGPEVMKTARWRYRQLLDGKLAAETMPMQGCPGFTLHYYLPARKKIGFILITRDAVTAVPGHTPEDAVIGGITGRPMTQYHGVGTPYVLPEWRGRGLGKALMLVALDRGFTPLWASTSFTERGLACRIAAHRMAVENAVAAGKTVPDEVLADYPHLRPGIRETSAPMAHVEPGPETDTAPTP